MCFEPALFAAGALILAGIMIKLFYINKRQMRKKRCAKIMTAKADRQALLLELALQPFPPKPDVVFDTRPKGGICCPHCWTTQPPNRDFCCGYRCGAKFVFTGDKMGE